MEWTVRMDILLNDTHGLSRFFVRFQSGDSYELVDKGRLPGSRHYDRLYSAQPTFTVSEPQGVQLTEVARDGRFRVLWSGTVTPLNVREDHISFRMDEAGDVAPMLLSMGMHPLEVRHNGAKVLGVAWLLSLLMMGGWWVQSRREEEVEE